MIYMGLVGDVVMREESEGAHQAVKIVITL